MQLKLYVNSICCVNSGVIMGVVVLSPMLLDRLNSLDL